MTKVKTSVARRKIDDAANNLSNSRTHPMARLAVGKAVAGARVLDERLRTATKVVIAFMSGDDAAVEAGKRFLREEGIEYD